MKIMKRRDVIKALSAGIIGLGIAPEMLFREAGAASGGIPENIDRHLKDYLYKMEHFDEPSEDDYLLNGKEYNTFRSALMRLRRLQQLVGYGNFLLLNFDRGLRLARRYPVVGGFSGDEIRFMEKMFYMDGGQYGFLGQKPMKNITDRIRREDVIKIPVSGNFLYKGLSHETYKKIRRRVGKQVILTSGVRGVMKQFLLFLNKAFENSGNLSLASRSLAPPGYSFHGSGDFDIGQAGLGALNFTGRFTGTEVYKELSDLGYLKLRYPRGNRMGVRFEPWHVMLKQDV